MILTTFAWFLSCSSVIFLLIVSRLVLVKKLLLLCSSSDDCTEARKEDEVIVGRHQQQQQEQQQKPQLRHHGKNETTYVLGQKQGDRAGLFASTISSIADMLTGATLRSLAEPNSEEPNQNAVKLGLESSTDGKDQQENFTNAKKGKLKF